MSGYRFGVRRGDWLFWLSLTIFLMTPIASLAQGEATEDPATTQGSQPSPAPDAAETSKEEAAPHKASVAATQTKATTSPESAQPDPSSPVTYVRTKYYGRPIAIMDAISLGIMGLSVIMQNPVGLLTAPIFVFGGPIVHLGQGNFGKSLWSLGKRWLFPSLGMFAGGFVGSKFCSVSEDSQGPMLCEKVILGIMLGYVVAGIFTSMNDTNTAFSEVKMPQASARINSPKLVAAPNLSLTPEGGLSVGIIGRF